MGHHAGDGVEVWDGCSSEVGGFGNYILVKGCQCPSISRAGLWLAHAGVYQYPKGMVNPAFPSGSWEPASSAIAIIYIRPISWGSS